MKKDRNTFFQESGFANLQSFPNMNSGNTPLTNASFANQSFYSGPTPQGMMEPLVNYNTNTNQNQNYNYNMNNNNNNYDYSDLESRLSKLERSINRLDNRLTKLESSSIYSTEDIENTNNIYMV